jgi:hypothetical protein
MISNFVLSANSLEVGETLTFQVHGSGVLFVEIKCFVDEPKPRGYRPCRECETTLIQSGQTLSLTADPETWKSWTGHYEIVAKDALGDERKVSVKVKQQGLSQYEAPTALSH